jgi:hypothetical protein
VRRRVGKRGRPVRQFVPTLAGRAGPGIWLVVSLASLCACGPVSGPRTISLQALEAAPPAKVPATTRHLVGDPDALRPLYQPLGRRLGLIQVRDAYEWDQFTRATGSTAPCPDLRRGIVVGLVSDTGTPLAGGWPFRWEAIRVSDRAGLIEAHFNGGNYLADGTTYLETAYIDGLSAVLVVSVDGVQYYPPQETAQKTGAPECRF